MHSLNIDPYFFPLNRAIDEKGTMMHIDCIHDTPMLKRAYRKTKAIINMLLGKELLIRPRYACRTERLGSDFGGWTICPDAVDKTSTIYSLGVGKDITFDIAMIRRFGITVHAFDPTPSSLEWIGRQHVPEQFIMHAFAVSDYDGDGFLIPPVDPKRFPHRLSRDSGADRQAIPVSVGRLGTLMRVLGHSSIDLLKMDIEGTEYQVIADMYGSNIRPSQLLVEFHHRFSDIGLQKTRIAVQQLNEMGYHLFALSDNHQEYSFIRS